MNDKNKIKVYLVHFWPKQWNGQDYSCSEPHQSLHSDLRYGQNSAHWSDYGEGL